MKLKLVMASLLSGFFMALGLVGITGAASNPFSQEMNLTAEGFVNEVNPDAHGNLWLSEYEADRVWQVNLATDVYTIYEGLPNASDARRDTAGNVWWSDDDGGNLGRISLSAGTVTTWTLMEPGEGYPSGIAFDDSGHVWVTDSGNPNVYYLNLTSNTVFTYTYYGSFSPYILFHDNYLWLGDDGSGQIVRLNPAANQFTRWQLHTSSKPEGLAVNSSGHIWWADYGLGALGRLEPTENRVTTYDLPVGVHPEMVALDGENVWYSEAGRSAFGVLNPATAYGTSTTVIPVTTTVASSSRTITESISSSVPISTGVAVWSPVVITTAYDSDGWQIYELPSEAYPWGIAAIEGEIYLADTGRDKLVHVSWNDSPVLVINTGLTVDEGGTETITNAMLLVTDTDNTPAELVYTVVDSPDNGALKLGVTLSDTFTQKDIDDGILAYEHNGSETTSDSFVFSVSDGAGGTIGNTTFNISVKSVNNPPVLVNNTGLIVNQGGTKTVTSAMLLVTDTDNPPAELTFSVEVVPDNGALKLGGTLSDTFTQKDIDDGILAYEHNGSETTSDSFVFSVSDGAGGTIGNTPFNITVTPIVEVYKIYLPVTLKN